MKTLITKAFDGNPQEWNLDSALVHDGDIKAPNSALFWRANASYVVRVKSIAIFT